MKPLPIQFLFRTALAGSAVFLATAASGGQPGNAPAPPAEFPAPLASDAALGDNAAWLWSAPPLPPWPGADLWEDYQTPLGACRLHGKGHAACHGPRQPLLSLVGGVLDGFFSLLAPGRAHGHPCQTALGDCGCKPPAGKTPDWVPEPPPRNVIPRPLPPPEAAGESPPAPSQRLYPGRAPVIELAPDPVLPPGLPPRNQIPSPGDQPPRNVIPPR